MLASIVVPTRGRDALLGECLKRLCRQEFDAAEFEIVVADDGACDSTRRLVENMRRGNRPAIRYVPVAATQGPAGARNAGWRAAKGTYVAFTDDDCLTAPTWLAEGVRALQSGADAATGRTIVPLPDRPTDRQRDAAGLATAEFITANCFCRRDVLETIGGFDERFTLAWREDSDLQFSLLERGMTIARAEKSVVVHPLRPLPWGVSLRQQRKSLFDPLLYRKHPELYRRRIAPLPRVYYVAMAGAVTAVAAALADNNAIVIAGITVWLFATALFAAKRLRNASPSPSHVLEMAITSALIPPLSIYWRLRGAWRYRAFYL